MNELPEKEQAQPKVISGSFTSSTVSVETRLKILEEIHENMFSMVKWGFGTLLTFALGLIAANIYTSHSTYEKDSATLKQDVNLLEGQLHLANEEQAFAMKVDINAAFVTMSNALENQVISIIESNNEKDAIFVLAVTNQMGVINSNALALDAAIKSDVMAEVTNNLARVANYVDTQFTDFQTRFEKQSDSAMGASLLVQANYTPLKSNLEKQSAYHDYILSAIFYIQAHDEENASDVIENLINKKFQEYILSISPEELRVKELEHPISDALGSLVDHLKSLNASGRYENNLRYLNYCNDVIKEKLLKK